MRLVKKNVQGIQSVDLGLLCGTLWANHNIGARHYADYGELYYGRVVRKNKSR